MWVVCIGVPYMTHVWQVADSEALNGCFSMSLNRAKQRMYDLKPMDKKAFYPTDIIPLINQAWPESFGRVVQAKKAIAERGWNPLNYSLLLHPDVKNKKEVAEKSSDLTVALNIEDGAACMAFDKLLLDKMRNTGRIENEGMGGRFHVRVIARPRISPGGSSQQFAW